MTSPRGRTKGTEALRWHTRVPRPTWRSSRRRQFSLWKPLFSCGRHSGDRPRVGMATSFIITNRAASDPAADRGYNAIEKARGAWAQSGVAADTSDAIKKAAAAKAQAMSGVAADTSYNAIENLRVLSGIDRRRRDRQGCGRQGPGHVRRRRQQLGRGREGHVRHRRRHQLQRDREPSRACPVSPSTPATNAAEKARGGGLPGPRSTRSTFDRTPRGAHGQLP